MPVEVVFESHLGEFQEALESQLEQALIAIGMTAETYAKECPVDTGRLRNSITHEVDMGDKSVVIGTNVEYAAFVELGTSKMRARPYLRPAAESHSEEYKAIVESAMKQ